MGGVLFAKNFYDGNNPKKLRFANLQTISTNASIGRGRLIRKVVCRWDGHPNMDLSRRIASVQRSSNLAAARYGIADAPAACLLVGQVYVDEQSGRDERTEES